jgi:hypothetical protein
MNTEPIMVKMALDAWYTQVKRTDELFTELTDEQLLKEVAPGRNRGVYLLGHLVAVHDRMRPLLGFGEPLHPELYAPFIEQADTKKDMGTTTNDLRLWWKEVNSGLADNFSKLSTDAWFQRHSSVSEEDFAKEPHRNKLNLVMNRTNHLTSHLGQLIFLRTKETGS